MTAVLCQLASAPLAVVVGGVVSGVTVKAAVCVRVELLVAVTDCAPLAVAPAPDHE